MGGRGGFMVATSALGTGVDFPRIVFVLHVGMPWSMIDYAQESGRGSRAGGATDSVILVEHGQVEARLARNGGSIDVQAMGLFIQGAGWIVTAVRSAGSARCTVQRDRMPICHVSGRT